MDTKPLHPAHILLGVTPESPARGRARVVTAFIGIAITTCLILAEDLQLFKHHSKQIISKVKAKSKTIRRGKRPTKLRIE